MLLWLLDNHLLGLRIVTRERQAGANENEMNGRLSTVPHRHSSAHSAAYRKHLED